ncbi:MAG: four-carbon acid sugar kinase family protein [Spirochaetaceae bacterium]|jgi:uncharacterized protein YgbK (DUF1537 family)|nr:four-carbon acid sugar kinase family protein [Spirochaetaceae bacterium]
MEQYLIVADDFTGANDTGVQLRRRGMPVSVVFSGALVTGDDSAVIDTESRALPAKAAYQKVAEELKNIAFGKFAHVMKKVDSTLRGNIAVETRAIDDVFKSELVIFAPALPDLGRTTVNRVHLLNGTPITRTELSHDPKTPVVEDNIQNILESAFDERVIHTGLEDVQGGNIDFSGGRLFTFDASTNADMRRIIRAALGTGKRILWVGTAAMADNFLAVNHTLPPALAVITSLSSVTRDQVRYAEKQGVKVVQYPIHDIIDRKARPEDFAAQVIGILEKGQDAMLVSASTYDPAALEKSAEAGARQEFSSEKVSEYMQTSLGPLTRKILESVKVSGLFLAGGDTAIGFFNAVGSKGSAIVTEIAVGIPLMRLRGGPFEGLRVVTKAGAFGKEDAIFYALRKLREADEGGRNGE